MTEYQAVEIIAKVRSVIMSCKTEKQLNNAMEYCWLALRALRSLDNKDYVESLTRTMYHSHGYVTAKLKYKDQ